MRKYIFLFTILCSHSLFSQNDREKIARREIDSMKKILPTLKGVDEIDCLNMIAYKFSSLGLNWRAQSDSSQPFATQANTGAKRIGYKKGLGYSYLRLAHTLDGRYGFDFQVYNKNNLSLLDTAEKYVNQAITIGEQINNNSILANAYRLLGEMSRERNDFTRYANYLNKAIGYADKAGKDIQLGSYDSYHSICENCQGNEYWLGRIYGELSNAYALGANPDLEAAKNALKKSLSSFHKSGHLENETFTCMRLSGAYLSDGNFESAFEYCKRNIELVNQLTKEKPDGDWPSGNAFIYMAELYKMAGDYQTSLNYIRQAHDYYRTDSFFLALWPSQMGNIHRLMGNYDSAMYYLNPYATNPQKFISAGILWSGTINLCDLYISLSQYEKALPLINTLIGKDNQHALGFATALKIAASVHLGTKNYPMALEYARQSLAQSKKYSRKGEIMLSSQLLSEIFHNLDRNDSAYYYLKQYTTLKDSIINRQFLWRLNNYKKEADEQRKTSQIHLLNKDNQLKEQKLKQQATLRNSLIAGILLLFLLGVFIFRSFHLKRKKQQAENDRKQTELEMKALRAQMNPHFIFNCLSSINKYILKNEPDKASDYLTRFSRLIRMVLVNSQRSLITLEDELEMLTIYLDMERMRFKNTFNYNIVFSNRVDTGAIFIPPLLLQPFCENAIWHGLKHLADHQTDKHDPGRLDIVLSMEGKVLNCSITDNGIGRKKSW